MSESDGVATTKTQGEVLQAFSKALQREVHNLTPRPDLLWQQLYNQLQWEEGPTADLAAAAQEQRSKLEAKPWIRARTPFRESKALIRTLAGVRPFAISPDGKWIVSASSDKTLKIWDGVSGRELHTLTGHTDKVRACAINHDGSYIVSASDDKTLKIWDAATGAEQATLAGHTKEDNACAISPDGAFIVSASDDTTLKIWDAATGAERATLTGHTGTVKACAIRSADFGMIRRSNAPRADTSNVIPKKRPILLMTGMTNRSRRTIVGVVTVGKSKSSRGMTQLVI